jgi:diguanylate cyclase (GGDEF)-like protein
VLSRRFGDALRAADSAAAEQVMDEALRLGVSPTAIQALVIGPAMVHIGELWESHAASVADEHLATAISHGVLVRLFDALTLKRSRSRERVMLAAVEGQQHVLGLRMVADVLEGAGFDVLYLGADVPTDALREFVVEHQPAVVGLSFAIGPDRWLAAAVAAVHDALPEPRVMVGGRGVPSELRNAAFSFVPSTLEALSTVERLLRESPRPLPSAIRALLSSKTPATWRPHDVGDADAVDSRLASVVEASSDMAREYIRQAHILGDLALRDAVTDMPNRRAFDDRIGLASHSRQPMALLMLDVDEFKIVNDTYGHDAGDDLLRLVGKVISQTIRPLDFAARIGGDEFAALLPDTTSETALAVGDRIRTAIAALVEPHVTVSIGVAPLAGDARAALLAADGALYLAKATGRDRIATPP